jgi:glycosyltransferase involved in cell wall biosynthesis
MCTSVQENTNKYSVDVSVIVPIYNAGKPSNHAWILALPKTKYSYEIVLVDDGSLNETAIIFNAYIEKSPEIFRYYFQNNAGSSNARNFGSNHARGTYIVDD